MRIYSYLFHALLALFAIGMAAISWTSGNQLYLDMLPWSGMALTYWLLGLGLAGLSAVLLALKGKVRIVFLLWSVLVLVLLVRGYFLSPYVFEDAEHFRQTLYLVAAAILAVLGAWSQLRRKPLKGAGH